MKYKGRICTMIFLVIINSIYIIYYHNKFGYIDIIQKIMTPILILIVWSLGKKFDEVQFYSQQINKNRKELHQICDSIQASLWSYDVCTNSSSVVMGVEKTYGLSNEKFLDNPMVWQEIVCQEDIKLVEKHEKELFLGKSSYIEYRIIKEDGEVRWVKNHGIPILDSCGKVTKINVMAIDITEQKNTEEKYKELEGEIKQLVFYDGLTGLPNRNMIDCYFNKLLESSKYKKQNIGVMFLDMDRFKIINDTMGHSFGDMVLQQFSKRLIKHVNKDDMICRYGGDEFIILLNDTNQIEATNVAKRIINEFSYPFIINQQKVFSSTSVGISLYPQNGEDLETLVKCADIAMFVAKEEGKNNYKFYDCDQSNVVSRKMYLENELRKALDKNEFILYYQPQFNLDTCEIVGVEALIRWQHPELGLVSPDEFIPIAEETGLIIPIGEWVIKTACKQNKSWQESGLPSIYIAVNVSAYQFQQNNFVENIKKVLKETKLNPKYLELEMTESIMQNIEQVTVVLNELKNIGIQLSLDDFGTGYSSLNVLRHLPIDTLKIDKSFIDDIISDVNAAPIIKTIIDMGRNLKLNVIAEGVENKEQVEFLKQNKCNVGQGYFFSRPLCDEDIEIKLANGINNHTDGEFTVYNESIN